MKCKQCGHWNRCPACQGWVCEACGAELEVQGGLTQALLGICQEIANDPHVDLVFSERRLRLYHALHKAQAL